MISLENIGKEARVLTEKWGDLYELFEDVSADNDWLEIVNDFTTWYYTAAQLMKEADYCGVTQFQKLYEDDTFSTPEFLVRLAMGGDYDETWPGLFCRRLWQMQFVLSALSASVGATRENESLGTDADQIRAALVQARKDLAEDRIAQGGSRIRTVLEHSVNYACILRGIVVRNVPPSRRFAKFCEKAQALRDSEVLNGKQAEALKEAYSVFSTCPHPGEKPSLETARNAVARVENIVTTVLLARPVF